MTELAAETAIALYRVEIEGKLFGAYTDEGEAHALISKLRQQGMDAKIVVKQRKADSAVGRG